MNSNYLDIVRGDFPLDQATPLFIDKDMFGLTISPPYNDTPMFEVLIYSYMWIIRDLLSLGWVFHTEFSDEGRLHFHGYIIPTEENYGLAYRSLNEIKERFTTRYKFTACFIYPPKPRKKMHKIVTRAIVKPEYKIKSNELWYNYCTKDFDKTRAILPSFCYIDQYNFDILENRLKRYFHRVQTR